MRYLKKITAKKKKKIKNCNQTTEKDKVWRQMMSLVILIHPVTLVQMTNVTINHLSKSVQLFSSY